MTEVHFVENIVNFNDDLRRLLKSLEDTIENFNGVENTINIKCVLSVCHCIQCFSIDFWHCYHCFQWFLVKLWDGFNGSLCSWFLHLKEQARGAQDCFGWGQPLHILPSWTSDLDLPSASLYQEPYFLFSLSSRCGNCISYILLQSLGGCTPTPGRRRHFCLPHQRSFCLYYGDMCFRSTKLKDTEKLT